MAKRSTGSSSIVTGNTRAVTKTKTPRGRPIVVVTGMHRSGTSLCAHVLSTLGVDMATEISPNEHNLKGHWERWEIVKLHDRILSHLRRDYFSPLHDLPFPPAWWANPDVVLAQREIEEFLAGSIRDKRPFGFKDPRTARLIPMWREIFKHLNLEPKYVLCLRSPDGVAASLNKRDGLAMKAGEYRYLTYLVDAFRYLESNEICIIEFERWFEDPLANGRKLMNFLGITWDGSQFELADMLSDTIDPALQHNSSRPNAQRQPLVDAFFQLARRYDIDQTSRSRLGSFIGQFLLFQKLQKPQFSKLQEFFGTTMELEAAQRELNDVRTSLANALAAVHQSGSQQLDSSENLSVVAQAEALAKTLSERNANLERMHAELASELRKADSCLQELTSERDQLRTAIHQAESWNLEIASELESARGFLRKLQVQQETVQQERNQLASDLLQSQDNERSLQELLSARDCQLEQHRVSVDEARERVQQLTNEIAAADRERELRAVEFASEARKMSTRLQELASERDQLRTALRQSESKNTEIFSELETNLFLLREAEARSDAIGRERDEFTAELSQSRMLERNSNTMLEWIQTKRDELIARLNDIQSERDQLQGQLAEANARNSLLLKEAVSSAQRAYHSDRPIRAVARKAKTLVTGAPPELAVLRSTRLVDSKWYLTHYPDVKAAELDAAFHYLIFGAAELRNPNRLFDTEWYLTQYPDVRKSGMNPIIHYARHGIALGYRPHPRFNPRWYLETYPDVRLAGMEPLAHWLHYGEKEGRALGPSQVHESK
jgi:hypothetical protein